MTNEEAIKDIEENIIPSVGGVSLRMAIEALKGRKTGKWIKTARNGVLCSECKSGTRRIPMLFGNPLYKYCPFCGVKMEAEK